MLGGLSSSVSRVSRFTALICELKGIATSLSLIANDLHRSRMATFSALINVKVQGQR